MSYPSGSKIHAHHDSINGDARREIADELRPLLADVFALFVKTKNFHWHMNGPHFRDYHLLLDEQSEQIFAMIDDVAERTRKLGQPTLHSIADIQRHQRLKDSNADGLSAQTMLSELASDNESFAASLRRAHQFCDERGDMATASLIENWVDQTERRSWFLNESLRT